MPDVWYTDSRDVIKWGVLFRLAETYLQAVLTLLPATKSYVQLPFPFASRLAFLLFHPCHPLSQRSQNR